MTFTLPLTPIQEAWNVPSMGSKTPSSVPLEQNAKPAFSSQVNQNSKISPYDNRYYSNYGAFLIEPGHHTPNILHVPVDRQQVIQKLITYEEPHRRNIVGDILENHVVTNPKNNNTISNMDPPNANKTPNYRVNDVYVPPSTPNSSRIEYYQENVPNDGNEDVMFFLLLLLIFIFIERILFICSNS